MNQQIYTLKQTKVNRVELSNFAIQLPTEIAIGLFQKISPSDQLQNFFNTMRNYGIKSNSNFSLIKNRKVQRTSLLQMISIQEGRMVINYNEANNILDNQFNKLQTGLHYISYDIKTIPDQIKLLEIFKAYLDHFNK